IAADVRLVRGLVFREANVAEDPEHLRLIEIAVRVRSVDRLFHVGKKKLHWRVPSLLELALVGLKPVAPLLLRQRFEELRLVVRETFEPRHGGRVYTPA